MDNIGNIDSEIDNFKIFNNDDSLIEIKTTLLPIVENPKLNLYRHLVFCSQTNLKL
jgi:hypothetical protein